MKEWIHLLYVYQIYMIYQIYHVYLYFCMLYKNNSKIRDQNINPNTLKVKGKIIGEHFYDLGSGKYFVDTTIKA